MAAPVYINIYAADEHDIMTHLNLYREDEDWIVAILILYFSFA